MAEAELETVTKKIVTLELSEREAAAVAVVIAYTTASGTNENPGMDAIRVMHAIDGVIGDYEDTEAYGLVKNRAVGYVIQFDGYPGES